MQVYLHLTVWQSFPHLDQCCSIHAGHLTSSLSSLSSNLSQFSLFNTCRSFDILIITIIKYITVFVQKHFHKTADIDTMRGNLIHEGWKMVQFLLLLFLAPPGALQSSLLYGALGQVRRHRNFLKFSYMAQHQHHNTRSESLLHEQCSQ